MPELYQRSWEVKVGELDISKLDLEFSIRKTSKREPNVAVVKVYNLSRASRDALQSKEAKGITIKAGYQDDPTLLFFGNTRLVFSERDDTDIVTTIEASDKGRELQSTRLQKSYAEGTPVVAVVRDLINALNIGQGNLNTFEAAYVARNSTNNFPDGYAVSGQARRSLNSIIRAAGLRWSVQDGVLQLQRPGRPLETKVVFLSAGTGLVGSPHLTSPDRGKKQRVSAVSLIQPQLYPGAKVSLKSDTVEGLFEILEVEYSGDTRGLDWYANLALRAL